MSRLKFNNQLGYPSTTINNLIKISSQQITPLMSISCHDCSISLFNLSSVNLGGEGADKSQQTTLRNFRIE